VPQTFTTIVNQLWSTNKNKMHHQLAMDKMALNKQIKMPILGSNWILSAFSEIVQRTLANYITHAYCFLFGCSSKQLSGLCTNEILAAGFYQMW